MNKVKGVIGGIISALVVCNMQLYANNPSPRLVVSIVVDQLRTDYMEMFSPLYSDGGLKKLMKEGRVYTNVDYPYADVNRAASVAAIYTGSMPNVNGITSNQWIERNKYKTVGATYDESFIGYYTNERSSARNLKVSTITDELKYATDNKAVVISIAPEQDVAIISAGQKGNVALWYNQDNGRWSGSTFYGEFPYWANRHNEQKGKNGNGGNSVWQPMYPLAMYKYMPNGGAQETFKHSFDIANKAQYERIKQSPIINDEVSDIAEQAISFAGVGLDEVTDYITVGYYAGQYTRTNGASVVEIQDAYVRLDKNIERVISKAEKQAGKGNVVFVLSSTGYVDKEEAIVQTEKEKAFFYDRVKALLNMYLMASYGDGQYISEIINNQIYFDRVFIEKKKLNLEEVISKSQEFVSQINGVYRAYTAKQIDRGEGNKEIEQIRNAYNPSCSGDIYIKVLPGFYVGQHENSIKKLERWNATVTPFIIMGADIPSAKITDRIDVRQIAPTVCAAIRIRGPNACTEKSLQ